MVKTIDRLPTATIMCLMLCLILVLLSAVLLQNVTTLCTVVAYFKECHQSWLTACILTQWMMLGNAKRQHATTCRSGNAHNGEK